MYYVCANYGNSVVWLDGFDTEKKATDFIGENKRFLIIAQDETLDGEDEYVESKDMFVTQEEIPFSESIEPEEYWDDNLPF